MGRLLPFIAALLLAALIAWRVRASPQPPLPETSDPVPEAPSPPPDPFRDEVPSRASLPESKGSVDFSSRLPEPAATQESAPAPAALRWLARAQNADGSWGFGSEEFEGSVYSRQGATALAVLAYFQAGYFHMSKGEIDGRPVGEVIRNGLIWLIANPSQGAFDTTLTALAWCEGYGFTNSAILKEHARRSLEAVLTYQSADGSWCGDEPVTRWSALVLRSASVSGLVVPGDVWNRAFERYDRQMAAGDTHNALAGWGLLRRAADEASVATAIAALQVRRPDWSRGDVTWAFHSSSALIALAGRNGKDQEPWRQSLLEQAKSWQESILETGRDTGTASVVGNALRQLTLEACSTCGSLGSGEMSLADGEAQPDEPR